jgi:REP element-mobilizing transposase RayT
MADGHYTIFCIPAQVWGKQRGITVWRIVGMSRSLRFVPRKECLFEVTVRTVQARLLLRPSVALNEIILGVLGRAQRKYGVDLCSFAFLSTHFHLLVKVKDAKQIADFMCYLNSNLAREVCRSADWKGQSLGAAIGRASCSSPE